MDKKSITNDRTGERSLGEERAMQGGVVSGGGEWRNVVAVGGGMWGM